MVIESVIQSRSDVKNSLGFGKNDLNILAYQRFPEIKVHAGVSLRRPHRTVHNVTNYVDPWQGIGPV